MNEGSALMRAAPSPARGEPVRDRREGGMGGETDSQRAAERGAVLDRRGPRPAGERDLQRHQQGQVNDVAEVGSAGEKLDRATAPGEVAVAEADEGSRGERAERGAGRQRRERRSAGSTGARGTGAAALSRSDGTITASSGSATARQTHDHRPKAASRSGRPCARQPQAKNRPNASAMTGSTANDSGVSS